MRNPGWPLVWVTRIVAVIGIRCRCLRYIGSRTEGSAVLPFESVATLLPPVRCRLSDASWCVNYRALVPATGEQRLAGEDGIAKGLRLR